MSQVLVLIILILAFVEVDCSPTQSAKDLSLYNAYGDVSNSSLIHGSENLEFERYKERVRILHNMLKEECQGHELSRLRRDRSSVVSKVKQEVELVLYERMTRMLIECRKRKELISAAITTTIAPPPEECISATNLTEFWRQDHNSSRYQPGGSYNCDFMTMTDNGKPWFRFTGAAGNMMLDRCVPENSCGAHAAIWTDVTMPSIVGVQTTVNAYGSYSNSCKQLTKYIYVMKCSDKPYDYIYKHYSGFRGCHFGFCGMTKY